MQTETLVYQGALRDTHGSNTNIKTWRLSNDTEALAKADDDDVIWESSIEGLLAELERRNPHPSGLTRCIIYGIGVNVYEHPIINTNEDSRDIAAGKILSAVKVAGTVSIFGWNGVPSEVYDECILVGNSPSTFEYNPKRAQAIKARDHRRSLKKPIQGSQFHNVGLQLASALKPYIDEEYFKGDRARIHFLGQITRMLWLHEQMFGRKSYRRVVGWQKFVKEWKDLREPTEAVLTKDAAAWEAEHQDGMAKTVADFIAFMGKEIKSKLPTPYASTEHGKVKQPIGLPQ